MSVLRKAFVRDYMSTELTLLHPEMDILSAVRLLIDNRVSGAPVVDQDRRLVGILTEKDCMKVVLNAAYHSEYGATVGELMVTDVETMTPDESIVDAAKRFYNNRYLRYPVLRDSKLVGLISRSDVMRAMGDFWR